MGQKSCSRCGALKPHAEYYKRQRSFDGLQPHCKVCDWKLTQEYRKRGNSRWKRYEEANRRRTKARAALGYALSTGKIKKRPCEVCGAIKGVHGHHDDYSKKLEVKWLCPAHHARVHAIAEASKR